MDLTKRRMLVNAFFLFQITHCPLVWMYHSRITNNKINPPHERFLRLICNNKQSSLHELLERDDSVSIRKRNLGFLTIKMFNIIKDIAPNLVTEIFPSNIENRYEMWIRTDFSIRTVLLFLFLIESLSCLRPKIWKMLPLDLKQRKLQKLP